MRSQESRSPESVVRDIRRKTRRKFFSEEKIRIVLEGLKGEESVSTICRREGLRSVLQPCPHRHSGLRKQKHSP
jgi:transposase